MKNRIGIVAIGRNEGARLLPCLHSIRQQAAPHALPVVYVDSGSNDGSPQLATGMAITTLELSPSLRYSAARARNAGFHFLCSKHPDLEFIQFVDGDSEVIPGWLESGCDALTHDASIAMVCGHVLEKAPHSSVYKRIAQIEWTGAIGDITACGGNSMVRVDPFKTVRGFNPSIIAAEDNEICLRLRRKGWRIHRLDRPMVTHDSPLQSMSQWWRRSKREGQCYIQVALLHWMSEDRLFVRPLASALVWGCLLPFLTLLATCFISPIACLISAAFYLALIVKAALATKRHKQTTSTDAGLYALFCVLGKLPQSQGIAQLLFQKMRGVEPSVVDYTRHPKKLFCK